MRVIVAIALCGSLGCAYHPPTAPSPLPAPVVTPSPTPSLVTPVVIAPPVLALDIAVTPAQPEIGQLVTFTASSGHGQAPLIYSWTFDGGSPVSGPEVTRTRTYLSEGGKIVRVTVTDANGLTATGTREFDVHRVQVPSRSQPPAPPSPPAPPPPTPLPSLSADLTCTALAHGSPSPCNVNASYGGVLLPSAAISNVSFDWGDGLTSSNGVVSTHTYANAGSYHVFATVTATTVDGSKTVTTSTAIDIP
jgi:PKD repeat protein